MDTLSFRLKDNEQTNELGTINLNLPSGLTIEQIQRFSELVAQQIDILSDAQITEITVKINLAVPAGLKESSRVGALNARGGLISFTTDGPVGDSFRIPAISRTIMPGDHFPVSGLPEDSSIQKLINLLTKEIIILGQSIAPRTAHNYRFISARSGKKSLRR